MRGSAKELSRATFMVRDIVLFITGVGLSDQILCIFIPPAFFQLVGGVKSESENICHSRSEGKDQ